MRLPTAVRCRAIDGVPHVLDLTVLSDVTTTGPLPARMVSVDGGTTTLLQKWVPRTDSGQPGPIGPLDREIHATHRFAQVFPPHEYPAELPRLRYYDVDSDEPFILLDPYRGVPLLDLLPKFTAQDRSRLHVSLLRALHLTGLAGMTHGRVDLDVLRWDDRTKAVQLVGFECATHTGEQDTAGIRDDMWDAGLAIWRTTHPTHVGREAPNLAAAGDTLSMLLGGVFVDPPASRPTPGDLLVRLREPVRTAVLDVDAECDAGRRAFDSVMRHKRERRAGRPMAPLTRFWSSLRYVLTAPRSEDDVPELVRCPMCLDSYPPPGDGLWCRDDDGQYNKVSSDGQDSLREDFTLLNAYRRCPNPSQDATEHFLPANYFAHDPPLVVAMVGQPGAGKTHLLAAMLREVVERDGLTPYGLRVDLMDLHRHDAYRTAVLDPARRGARLPPTPGKLTEPANILLVKGPGGTRPLVLFDVAGENLQSVGDGELARFLVGVNAVIFVHGLEPAPEQQGNRALEMSLARLQAVPALERLPTAIVVTKSDRLRYHPSVNRWLGQEHDRLVSVDPDLLYRESRDAYAFLHHRQEYAPLAPFSVFDRCTLHFVSASGCEAEPDKQLFPRGFEPSRVLQPLVAILAMAGMLEGDQMRIVGT